MNYYYFVCYKSLLLYGMKILERIPSRKNRRERDIDSCWILVIIFGTIGAFDTIVYCTLSQWLLTTTVQRKEWDSGQMGSSSQPLTSEVTIKDWRYGKAKAIAEWIPKSLSINLTMITGIVFQHLKWQ
jgi:hypothetical protein